MKPVSNQLSAYLARASQGSAPLLMAECFTITLQNGSSLNVTNADLPVTCDGAVYYANTLMIDGLKYNADRTLSVDSQKIVVTAGPDDSFAGAASSWDNSWDSSWGGASGAGPGSPFLLAVAAGLLDGATLTRRRAFLSNWLAPAVGSVTMFVGRIATVDEISRVSATITVNSDLAFLDVDMPRSLFSSNCVWTLYGAGCQAVKGAYTLTGTAGAGCTPYLINWSGALAAHAQGSLVWTSGANDGLSVTIGAVTSGVSLSAIAPMIAAPAAGDAFTISYGCDHTRYTCRSRFANLANYRGYDFVPPPVMAI